MDLGPNCLQRSAADDKFRHWQVKNQDHFLMAELLLPEIILRPNCLQSLSADDTCGQSVKENLTFLNPSFITDGLRSEAVDRDSSSTLTK